MTLVFRNKTIIACISASLLIFVTLLILTVLFYLNHGAAHIVEGIRPLPILQYQVMAVFASIFVLLLYVAFAGFTVYFMFEKTQSSEIIYFCLFLFSCLFEGLRFCILLVNSPIMYPELVLFAARGVFFGRICASLTFLTASIFCGGKLEQDPERICYLIIAASVVTAILIPFNTAQITSNAMLTYGYMNRIFFIRILFACITFLSFLLNCFMDEVPEFKITAFGFTLLYAGYLLLTITDTLAVFCVGSILFGTGTWLFLSSLHRYYLWK